MTVTLEPTPAPTAPPAPTGPVRAWETADLVHAARRGDDRAYAELVSRHERQVRAAVRSFRLGEADSADAVQMTWLRLVENLDKLNDPTRVGAWLTTTAKRECLRLIRRGQREVGTPEEFFAAVVDDSGPGPEQLATQDAMAAVLRGFLAELPGKAQRLLEIAVMADHVAYAEIATVTGMPVGSIGPTRGRYLTRLRRRIEESGVSADTWL